MFILQVPPPPPGSVDPLFGWLFGVMMTLFSGAIGKLYWDSRQDSKRKDTLIDQKDALIIRLSEQVGRLAGATDRTVKLAERRDREREER